MTVFNILTVWFCLGNSLYVGYIMLCLGYKWSTFKKSKNEMDANKKVTSKLNIEFLFELTNSIYTLVVNLNI